MNESEIKKELDKGENASIVKLVSGIIDEACARRASDIHIDPNSRDVCVRYRVDGVLQEICRLPARILPEVISRIKILSGLRTDEHQQTQDGRFRTTANGILLDIRVSIAPTYHGENGVLRLLADKNETFTLERLGFSDENAQKIRSALNRPYGMILSTGPTGSGKTTTLYTLLKALNTPEISIVTVEDPVEYSIDGIQQIQVNPRTGLAFASGLRGILRQDPNVIMVGEIRDPETAGIAVNAALTGHLMLSTLHTNDAATTLPRLLDMGVESYLIASTVNAVVGQRLVRRICSNCKTTRRITAAEKNNLQKIAPPEILENREEFFFGKGCANCAGSGYFGRVGVHEVIIPDPVIREAVLNKETAGKLKQIAVCQGMKTITDDGFSKAMAGITTIEEVLRMNYE